MAFQNSCLKYRGTMLPHNRISDDSEACADVCCRYLISVFRNIALYSKSNYEGQIKIRFLKYCTTQNRTMK
jgi:hypothetical protein